MNDCPFCDYAGPSEILRDYGDVFVVKPLREVTPGHVLVIPRIHADDAAQYPALTGRVMACAAQYIQERDRERDAAEPYNIITSIGSEATQTVFHLHVHVVPRFAGDELKLPWTEHQEKERLIAGNRAAHG